jgi:hypothetical protein
MVYSVTSQTSEAFFDSLLSKDSDCLVPSGNSVLSSPHSAAFLDLDGDCMPDLFLTKTDTTTKETWYEIYIQKMEDNKK